MRNSDCRQGRLEVVNQVVNVFDAHGKPDQVSRFAHFFRSRTILRHLKRAVDPPPIAPARACQATFAWTAP